MMQAFIKKNLLLLLLIIFSIPAIYALFHPGFFVSDDGEWMIIRLSAFFETLRSGEFPVRFIARLNNGYGYPLGNFMYPGFLYLGSLIHLLGFGFTSTIKIIFGVSTIFSGIFSYLWLQKLCSKYAAFFGALVYVYMPYHLFDLYSRGSLGEILALGVIPFIFWQIERRDSVLLSLSIACLILSHNTVAFLCMIPIFFYLFLRSDKGIFKRVLFATSPILLGLLISSFFWIPALYDLQYTIFKTVVISDWRHYFATVEIIGLGTFGVLLLSSIVPFLKSKTRIRHLSLHYFFWVVAGVSIAVSLPISTLFWTVFPVSIVQFPFRMLTLTIPAIAFLLSSSLDIFSEKKMLIIGIATIVLTIILGRNYLTPATVIDKGDAYYTANFSTTTIKDEYMPIWVKKPVPPLAREKVVIVNGDGKVENQISTPKNVHFSISTSQTSIVRINTVYFPGWEVVANDQKRMISTDPDYGLMQVSFPPGNYTVKATFTETPARFFADMLSLIGMAILAMLIFLKLRYNASNLKK